MSLERISLTTRALREEQFRFRLLWIGIFCVSLLLASIIYPSGVFSLRSLNGVLLAAIVWNLLLVFTPSVKVLRSAFDPVTILADIILITWAVRVTGGFHSEFILLYFIELLLTALFMSPVQHLLAFFYATAGLCSSLLTVHSQEISGMPQGFLIRVERGKPEDLSALGVRVIILVGVYLVGYVGRSLLGWEKKTAHALEKGESPLPASANQARMIESNAESNRLSQEDEHLSIISHELRSPLTILRAYTDLLMDPNRQNGLNDIVGRIDEEVSQLSEMISNLDAIIDERSSPPLKLGLLNLASLLQSVVEKEQSLSSEHQLTFRCDHPDLPVRGDKVKLTRAFTNLLGNALKYSPQGGRIEVSAEVQDRRAISFLPALPTSDAEKIPYVLVRVVDFGIGMSSQAVTSAFEKFRRVDTERTCGIPGSGLGLYLTRKIVEQHFGEIHLESIEGKGTTVSIALPLAAHGDVRD